MVKPVQTLLHCDALLLIVIFKIWLACIYPTDLCIACELNVSGGRVLEPKCEQVIYS